MKKQNLLLSLFTLGLLFTLSCKKGEVGPQGTPGKDADPNKYWSSKEGYIKGTLSGRRLDSTSYSYNIDFEGITSGADNAMKINSSSETQISIYKIYAEEGENFVNAEAILEFNIPSINSIQSSDTFDLSTFEMDFTKDVGQGKFFVYHRNFSSGSSSAGKAKVFNLNYNPTTKILTGKYTATLPANADNGSLNISNESVK